MTAADPTDAHLKYSARLHYLLPQCFGRAAQPLSQSIYHWHPKNPIILKTQYPTLKKLQHERRLIDWFYRNFKENFVLLEVTLLEGEPQSRRIYLLNEIYD